MDTITALPVEEWAQAIEETFRYYGNPPKGMETTLLFKPEDGQFVMLHRGRYYEHYENQVVAHLELKGDQILVHDRACRATKSKWSLIPIGTSKKRDRVFFGCIESISRVIARQNFEGRMRLNDDHALKTAFWVAGFNSSNLLRRHSGWTVAKVRRWSRRLNDPHGLNAKSLPTRKNGPHGWSRHDNRDVLHGPPAAFQNTRNLGCACARMEHRDAKRAPTDLRPAQSFDLAFVLRNKRGLRQLLRGD